MALTGWSAANYLTRAGAPLTARPMLLSGWGVRFGGGTSCLISIGQDGVTTDRRTLLRAVGSAQATERGSTTQSATSSNTWDFGVWGQLSAWFVSGVLREALLNAAAASMGTDTGNITPAAPTHTIIGVLESGAQPWEAAGAIAEVSLWDGTGLDAAERRALDTALAGGVSPLRLNASGAYAGLLVAYYPLRTEEDLEDASGNGHDLTLVGSLQTFSSHPNIEGSSRLGGAGITAAYSGSTGIASVRKGVKLLWSVP